MIVIGALVGVAAGAFTWFFFEYVLHRWAFHEMRGRGFASREHLDHHATSGWSFDPMILLAWLGVVLSGGGWAALVAWPLGPVVGGAFGAGWVAGYFFYEWHHRAAHLRAPRNRWEVWLRIHHFQHHFGHPMLNHGVTISLWDHVFGTNDDPDIVRVPRRFVMPWLVDADGAVREEFASRYEIVGTVDRDERQRQIDRARAYANLDPTP